jgi:hypothetical protein
VTPHIQVNLADPWSLVPFMLATHPSAVAAIPIFAPHDPDSTLILRARRHSQRIPPELAARIAQSQAAAASGSTSEASQLPTHIDVGRLLLTIPADVAENFRGPVLDRHVAYLVLVQRDAYDGAKRQAETGIVLPGGPVNGTVSPFRGIVKP